MDLTDVKGVNEQKEQTLKEAGYKYAECLAWSCLKEVTKLDGIGPDVVMNAQELCGLDDKKLNPDQMIYCCPYCARGFQRDRHGVHLSMHQQSCSENPANQRG